MTSGNAYSIASTRRVPVDDDFSTLVLLLDLLEIGFEDGVLDVGNLRDKHVSKRCTIHLVCGRAEVRPKGGITPAS